MFYYFSKYKIFLIREASINGSITLETTLSSGKVQTIDMRIKEIRFSCSHG